MDETQPAEEDANRAKPLDDEPAMDRMFDRAIRKLESTGKGKINDKTLQRQKSVIGVLKVEQKEILNNLNVSNSTYHVNYNNKTISGITNLLQDVSKYDKKIHTEKAYLADLNSQIEKTRFAVLQERKHGKKSVHGGYDSRENVVNGLESKLHTCKVKLNETLKENKKLREEIDLYLTTRTQFNNEYNAMIQKLNTGKTAMEDLLDQSSYVYNQREKLIMRLAKLKEKDQTSLRIQRGEMYELIRNKPKEKAFHKFINDKNQDRSHLMLNKKETLATEMERCKTERLMSTYRQLLDEIHNYNTENVGNNVDLVENYKQEEINVMQLLLYNNELNDELEVLEEDLKVKMHQYMERKDIMMDERFHQSSVISSMNGELSALVNDSFNIKRRLEYHSQVLKDLLEGTEKLFDIGGCEHYPLLQLLGDNKHVTQYNYKLFLNIFEQKILEILNSGQFPLIPAMLPAPFTPVASTEGFPGVVEETISHLMVASVPCTYCPSKQPVGGDDRIKKVAIQ